jgi:type I restriction enzyme M protein
MLDPERLAEKLSAACTGACTQPQLVPLSAAATAVAMLGMHDELYQQAIHHIAGMADPLPLLTTLWKQMVIDAPFLSGHLAPLFGWADNVQLADLAALRRCFAVFDSIDVRATVSQPGVDGEILGPLYQMLASTGAKAAKAAFYTPMSLARMMAKMSDVQEGQSVMEPAVGAGVMVVAIAKEMRAAGRRPETCSWTLIDIDPIAVALSGINAVVHGLGRDVTLICGDALQMPLTEVAP